MKPEQVPLTATSDDPVIVVAVLMTPALGLEKPALVEHCIVTVVDVPPGLMVALAVTVDDVAESTLAAETVGAIAVVV